MTKKLFLLILKSNIIAAIISLVLSWINYQSIDGFEERQGYFALFIVTIVLCIFNFGISLIGLLNSKPAVRENKLLSILTLIGAPLIMLLLFSGLFFTSTDTNKTFLQFFSLAGPSLFYILGLLLFMKSFKKVLTEG
jgi:hypothetical protein